MTTFEVNQIVNQVTEKVLQALRAEKNLDPERKYVTAKEAAQILGISEYHVRRIKDSLPHRKVGNAQQGRLMFLREGLQENYLNHLDEIQ